MSITTTLKQIAQNFTITYSKNNPRTKSDYKIVICARSRVNYNLYIDLNQGYYTYERKGNDFYSVFIDNVDLLKDKEAVKCDVFLSRNHTTQQNNIDIIYQSKDGLYHFIRNNTELLKGRKIINFTTYPGGVNSSLFGKVIVIEDGERVERSIQSLIGRRYCHNHSNGISSGDYEFELLETEPNGYQTTGRYLIKHDNKIYFHPVFSPYKGKATEEDYTDDNNYDDYISEPNIGVGDSYHLVIDLKDMSDMGKIFCAMREENKQFKEDCFKNYKINLISKYINTETSKVLTLEEVKEQGLEYHDYELDGVYEYRTKDGEWYLIIGGKNVLEGLKAVGCCYYRDGVYSYKATDRKWRLIIDGVNVLRDIEAFECDYYEDGAYSYADKYGGVSLIIKGVNVLEDTGAVKCWYSGDGYCRYKTDYEDGYKDVEWHDLEVY